MFFKIGFLKISQYSQENTWLESPFNKVAGLSDCIFIEKETPAQVLCCEYCELFYKTPAHYTVPKSHVLMC